MARRVSLLIQRRIRGWLCRVRTMGWLQVIQSIVLGIHEFVRRLAAWFHAFAQRVASKWALSEGYDPFSPIIAELTFPWIIFFFCRKWPLRGNSIIGIIFVLPLRLSFDSGRALTGSRRLQSLSLFHRRSCFIVNVYYTLCLISCFNEHFHSSTISLSPKRSNVLVLGEQVNK